MNEKNRLGRLAEIYVKITQPPPVFCRTVAIWPEYLRRRGNRVNRPEIIVSEICKN